MRSGLTLALIAVPLLSFSATEVDCWIRDVSQDHRAAFYGYGEGLAAAALVASKSRLVRTEPNAYEPTSLDRIEAISWARISLPMRRTESKPQAPLFDQLKVDGKGILLPHDLTIEASTPGDVERVLGKPDKKEGSIYRYAGVSDGCEDTLAFHFRQGRLSAVEWDWCYE